MYLLSFVFWFPLVMCTIWIIGGTVFYFTKERTNKRMDSKEINQSIRLWVEKPFVSLLVPCYNEEKTITETVEALNSLNYPLYEIILINDGSKDNTAQVLRGLSERFDKCRVINLKKNSGKANALYLGFIASKGEILVCIDADALLDKDALFYLVRHFTQPQNGERVGAVTGNPRIRNRSSLLARIQVCEYSSIIGLIKRSQRILGKVMTVSGVIVAFRKRALLDCGLWDRDLITEDIGVTWKLQRRFWDVRYEPNAICWMLVPETLKGLWNQRIRWAQGGIEVLLRHYPVFFDWKQRRIIPIYVEQLLSVIWSISWVIALVYTLWKIIEQGKLDLPILWQGTFLSLLCIIQFSLAMLIEKRYDQSILKYYLWAVWYPVFYWYFNAVVLLCAIPKAIFSKKSKYAVWESPDRGLGL
jgi:biofilm PGA synthesis N-glycosyltransferase PgaC